MLRNDFKSAIPSEHEGYFLIPGFSRYLASIEGVIVDRSNLEPLTVYERPTSKGSYLNVSMSMDISVPMIQVSVHRVICFAFHGPASNVRDDVNHVDGDKHNNRPGNLHWCSRSENLRLSYETGLRKDNRKVKMTDLSTGTVKEFYSLGELARFFKVSDSKIWFIVRDATMESPYLDRYVIEKIDWEKVTPRKSSWTKLIFAKDYSTGNTFVCKSLAEAEQAVGILRATIYYNLNLSSERRLIDGWYFRYEDGEEWPVFTEVEVRKSKLQTASGSGDPISVLNTITGVVTEYGALALFAKSRCAHPNTIRRIIKRTDGKYEHYVITRL